MERILSWAFGVQAFSKTIQLAISAATTKIASGKSAQDPRLDTTKELRVYTVNLDGHDLLVFQRAFQDWASKPEYAPTYSPEFEEVFALGYMDGSKFRILHWKENTGDDNEQILGVIHLRAGRDFLVSASSNPEGNEYRVYGYRDGKLVIVFQGGGGEC